MAKISGFELLSRARTWLAEQGFEVDEALAVDSNAPARLKDPADPRGVRSVCVWASSKPPRVSYYDHHSGASGFSYLDTIEIRAGMEG